LEPVFVVASIKFSKNEHDEKAKRDKETGSWDGSVAESNQGLPADGVAHGHLAESLENPMSAGAGASSV
jgi:hypothetical protein